MAVPRKPAGLALVFDCDQDWSKFEGAGQTRFCQSCTKQVHDLSTLTRREARELMQQPGPKPCIRFRHDGEGRVMFRSERRPGRLVWQRFVDPHSDPQS